MTRKKCDQCEDNFCYLLRPYTFLEKHKRKQLIENNNIDEELCCLCNRLKGRIRYRDCCYQCRSKISMGIIYNKHQGNYEKTIDDFCEVILDILIDGPITSTEIRDRIPGETRDINRAIKKLYRNGKITMIKQGRKYPYALVESVYSKSHFKFVESESTNNKQLSKQKEGVILE